MATLYIMCGIPGSGKSTLVQNLPASMMVDEKINIISSDDGRKIVLRAFGFPNDIHQDNISDEILPQEKKDAIEKELWTRIERTIIQVLQHNEDVILDATNTEQWNLEKWFKLAIENGYKSKVIIMTTPLNICIERNSSRDEPVPHEVMEYMYNNYIMTVGWLYMEHSEKIINSAHLQY